MFRGENPKHFMSTPSSPLRLREGAATSPFSSVFVCSFQQLSAYLGGEIRAPSRCPDAPPAFSLQIVPRHGARGLSPAATRLARICSLGGTPSKPSLEQGVGEKAYSSGGKGISEQWVSQSQPPSHTASLFWLPGAHTFARLLRLPCRPPSQGHGRARHALGTHVRPHYHSPGGARCLSPAPQHGEQFQHTWTSVCRASSCFGGQSTP